MSSITPRTEHYSSEPYSTAQQTTARPLPSRRELRLQREAAQRAAQALASAQPKADTAVVDSIEPNTAPVVTDTAPTSEIPAIANAETLASRLTWPPLAEKNFQKGAGRKIAAAAATFATFALVGSALSVLTVSNVNDALAAQGDPNPELVASATIEPVTPDSLKKADGAADSARYRDLERELSGAKVQCDVRSGANSLVSAFVEDEEYVVNPMGSDSYSLSSNFGWRYDPFTRLPSKHLGQDFAAPAGTPIYAIADGTVVHVGDGIDGRSSNLIVLAHEIDGVKYTSWYVHMYDDGVHVKLGDDVKAGQHIGDVGSKGRSTGPHLHFEIHEGHELISEDGSNDHVLNPLETLAKLGSVDISEIC